MTIQFISPNPDQKKALDELEKLLSIMDKAPTRELKQNMRFVRGFTRALLFAGKNYTGKSRERKSEKSAQYYDAQLAKLSSMEKPQDRKLVTHGEWDKLPKKVFVHEDLPSMPPLPPPPAPAPIPESGINVKGGSKNFQDFMLTISKENGILKFNILEPEMESVDWKIFQQVKNKLKQQIMKNPEVLEQESFLIDEIKNTCNELKIKYSDSYLKKIRYYLIKYTKGFGKVDPLIVNEGVSEIICNYYNDIKVKYKNEILPTNIQFDSNEELDNFIMNLAEKAGQEITEEKPTLEIIYKNLKISVFYNPIMGSRFTIVKQ